MTSEIYPIHFRALRLYLDRPFGGYGSDLRRAITAALPDEPLLHHHKADGSSDYSAAQVRYLVLDGQPWLLSFHDGKEVVEQVVRKVSSLSVGRERYLVAGYDFLEDITHVGIFCGLIAYRSRTPWLALNQENQRRFEKSDFQERRRLLERILVGNYLSAMKGLGVRIHTHLEVRIAAFRSVGIFHLPTAFVGLSVVFRSNMLLPEFLGLGKMPAKGYGLMSRANTVTSYAQTGADDRV